MIKAHRVCSDPPSPPLPNSHTHTSAGRQATRIEDQGCLPLDGCAHARLACQFRLAAAISSQAGEVRYGGGVCLVQLTGAGLVCAVCVCIVRVDSVEFCKTCNRFWCRGNSSVVERWIPVPAVGGSIPSSLTLCAFARPFLRFRPLCLRAL
jgi:hypothetical protein